MVKLVGQCIALLLSVTSGPSTERQKIKRQNCVSNFNILGQCKASWVINNSTYFRCFVARFLGWGKLKLKNFYDFGDFVKVMNCHGIAVEMNALDYSTWERGASRAKFTRTPVLADLSLVQFRRGSRKIFGKQTRRVGRGRLS